jgi:hypothetical protein
MLGVNHSFGDLPALQLKQGVLLLKLNMLLAGTAVAIAFGAAAAHADTITYNSNPTPGWVFGTGNNSPNNTAVDMGSNGLELDLRAHERFHLPPNSVGNLYSFATGQDIGIDFGVFALSAINASTAVTLTVFDIGHNHSQSFDPALIPDNTTTLSGGVGFQNSEALMFPVMDSLYNMNDNNSFLVTLASTVQGGPALQIAVNQGLGATVGSLNGGVPEPASWALMIMGFGAVGAVMRRRQQSTLAMNAFAS